MSDNVTHTIEEGSDERVLHTVHPAAPGPLQVVVAYTATGAVVIYIDTPGWDPTPDALRINVNDGPAWNYPDEGTQSYGATGPDLPFSTPERIGTAARIALTVEELRQAARRSIRTQNSLDPLADLIPDNDTALGLVPLIEAVTGRQFPLSGHPGGAAPYARTQLRRWALREYNHAHANRHTTPSQEV